MLLMHWFGLIDFSTFLKLYLFGYVFKFIILFFIQWKNNHLDFEYSVQKLNLKEIISFGLFVLVGGASIMIVTRLDMMMIGSLLDLEQVAFYTVAFFIGNAIKVPGKSIATISTPLLAKAWENQNMKEIQVLYTKSSINQLIIGGVFFLCVWINIDEIFSLLPLKFQDGKWVVFYIGLSQLFSIASGVNGAIIINSKYYKYDLYTNLLLVGITIASNLILIPKYGIDGAAMATAISVLLFNLIRLILIKVKMNMHPFSLNSFKTILVLFVIYYLLQSLPKSSILLLDIFRKSAIIIILYIPLVLWLKLSEDITKFTEELRKKLLL